MRLELQLYKPVSLRDGRRDGLIYTITDEDLNRIPDEPGIYVFARKFGEIIAPLYIGQAKELFYRVQGQLNNLRLMRGVEDAEIGQRMLLYAQFYSRPGQRLSKALDVIESALIENALTQGFELLNVQGVKTPTHELAFWGNLTARKTFPRNMFVRAR